MISSRIVLTCAHNLYSEGREANSIKFVPAVSASGKNSKGFQAKKIYFPEEYKHREDGKYDYGIIELEEDLEESYGYLGIDTRDNNIE